jgi:hypothetical protein
MPILSVFFGIIVRMWHDDHPPPHIHAEYQGFEAFIEIHTGEVSEGRLPKKAAAIVKEWCLRHQAELLENWERPSDSNLWNVFLEQIKMIKVLEARYLDEHRVELVFSDGKEGVFDASALLLRTGALVEALRDESYFKRLYIDAGALCWPNGLELAPSRLYENCMATTLA